MERKYKIMIATLALVAVLTTVLATTAFAASGLNTPGTARPVLAGDITPAATPTDADYQEWGCPMANGNYEAVASLLGITPQEIDAQLEQGKSLLEIASARGVSEDKLVAAIFAPMQQFMQQQLTSGTWTQAQIDSHLKQAEQHIRQLVNAKGNAYGYGGNGGCGGAGGMMGNGSGGMMGRGFGGMMGNGFRGMMGDGFGGRTGGGFGGMMGNW